jgi:hypothetical protein
VIHTRFGEGSGRITLLPVRASPAEKEITIRGRIYLRVPKKEADREEKEEGSE